MKLKQTVRKMASETYGEALINVRKLQN